MRSVAKQQSKKSSKHDFMREQSMTKQLTVVTLMR
jgi:hypothetical protein